MHVEKGIICCKNKLQGKNINLKWIILVQKKKGY